MKPSHPSDKQSIKHQTVKERYLLNLWNDYLHSGKLHQLDRFLAQALRQIKSAGKRDRLWYGDHLFAMSRFSWLALFVASLPRKTLPLGKTLTLESLQAHLDHWHPPATIAEAQKALLGLPAQTLWQTTWQRLHPDDSTDATWLPLLAQLAAQNNLKAQLIWAGISPHWQPRLLARAEKCGWTATELQRFVEAHTSRPPLYIRPVANKKAAVIEDLQQNQLQVQSINNALAVVGSKGLYELESYKQGWFEIQDLASQAIGSHVTPQSGDLGWDACAGGGGKSLQLASLMQGKGAVYASDIREHKLEEIRRRAQRAQLHNIRTFTWQGEPLDRLPAAVQKRGGFDWVLVDAPCTSSGTWRRNPDARWRCDENEITSITALQTKLLDSAAASVRPGGKLVYSTCSFFVEENEAIIETFLQNHPDFSLHDQQLHGNPQQDADTMFSALLVRNNTIAGNNTTAGNNMTADNGAPLTPPASQDEQA